MSVRIAKHCILIMSLFVLLLCPSFCFADTTVEQPFVLTADEKQYIDQNPVIEVLIPDGVQPIQYFDNSGNLQGIAKGLFDDLSAHTGLRFKFVPLKSTKQSKEILADKKYKLVGIIANQHLGIFPGIELTNTFMKVSMFTVINRSVDMNDLSDKRFAYLEGSNVPEGVNKINMVSCGTREDTIAAVNDGRADYVIANSLTVTKALFSGTYPNIFTVPTDRDQREYAIGVSVNEPILKVIINKGLASFDASEKDSLLLSAIAEKEDNFSFAAFWKTHYIAIIVVISLLVLALVVLLLSVKQSRDEAVLQNRLMVKLAEITDDYTYEYQIRTDTLRLSKTCAECLGLKPILRDFSKMIKYNILNSEFTNATLVALLKQMCEAEVENKVVSVNLTQGKVDIFSVTNAFVYGSNKQPEIIIGKLKNITNLIKEKSLLEDKAHRDGMTNVYNAATVQAVIVDRMKKLKLGTDAFIIIDVDKFKRVNDTLGHAVGDEVLKRLAFSLKMQTRSNDIVGRLGGDEFCVYLTNISSMQILERKCTQIKEATESSLGRGFASQITVSQGALIVEPKDRFESIYERADKLLYVAKAAGGNTYRIETEPEQDDI